MRPYPPEADGKSFVPAPELEAWARETFIDPSGRLHNPEHQHLESAVLGFVWAFVPGAKGGRAIAGLCEMTPISAMGKWQRARAAQQLGEWFEEQPVALITICAQAASEYDDASFCALIEHELLHVGDAGCTDDGRQKYESRPHDFEEFSSIVRRYGVAATELQGIDFSAAPEIGVASVKSACGSCLRLVKG